MEVKKETVKAVADVKNVDSDKRVHKESPSGTIRAFKANIEKLRVLGLLDTTDLQMLTEVRRKIIENWINE